MSFIFLILSSVRADHFPIQVDDFEILEIQISGKVDWVSGQPAGSIDCSAALFSEIEVEQNGKKLTLNWKNNGKSGWQAGNEKIAIHLSSELLRRVEISGSSDLIIKGVNKTPEFNLGISGSGDFRGNLDCSGNAGFSVNGSGNISLTGNCIEMNLRISGSGDFKGPDFNSEKAKIRISGSGDAEVFAKNELDASISGSGNIRFGGNPEKVSKSISGSGTMQKKVN